ncbi:MAG: cupin domain-containing protein [Cyclobacteriaceae bacterium]|nr:cupin domain-containing protein [Cyclobacteriaceae bacterium]
MHPVEFWIEHLSLLPHPEGGFYKETYRSPEELDHRQLPPRYKGARNFSTAIYFLLRAQDRSVFHRIQSDELWHFYAGTTLLIYVLTSDGLKIHRLGADPLQGDALQVLIPAGCWFGAIVEKPDSYALCGCTVAPGFDFADFEMAERDELLKAFPDQEDIIMKLT